MQMSYWLIKISVCTSILQLRKYITKCCINKIFKIDISRETEGPEAVHLIISMFYMVFRTGYKIDIGFNEAYMIKCIHHYGVDILFDLSHGQKKIFLQRCCDSLSLRSIISPYTWWGLFKTTYSFCKNEWDKGWYIRLQNCHYIWWVELRQGVDVVNSRNHCRYTNKGVTLGVA